jgi:CO/xanthine dehydrogenase Mo-binding subunit
MICTRADDARFDSPRSPSVQHVRMAFDADGKVSAMVHEASAGWPTQAMIPALLAKDKQAIRMTRSPSPAPTTGTRWRAARAGRVERPGQQQFPSRLAAFRGAGLDELGRGKFHGRGGAGGEGRSAGLPSVAVAGDGRNAGSAPNARRAARLAHVLRRAAEKAGWARPCRPTRAWASPPRSARSATCPPGRRGARVKVDRSTCMVRVEKLTMDRRGHHRRPDGALAQAEGGALWGLEHGCTKARLLNGGEDTNLE